MVESITKKLNEAAEAKKDKKGSKDEASEQQFGLQRLYVKEQTLKLNNAPQLFTQTWKPETSMEIQVNTNAISEDVHEVILQVNVTTKNNNITAFTAVVQQAGLFSVKGFTADQIQQLLLSHGSNMLFPYARKLISDMSIEASLPPILLSPIDFIGVYLQQQAEASKKKAMTIEQPVEQKKH